MDDFATFVLANEPGLRLGGFLGVLAVMALWELSAPRRRLSASRWQRWSSNLGILALDALMLRLMAPIAAVGAALLAEEEGWGLFNVLSFVPQGTVPQWTVPQWTVPQWTVPQWTVPQWTASGWTAMLASILVLDLAVYGQHVVFHKVPFLWRLHRVHHTDVDLDATSGVRFHPLEIALSLMLKIAVIVALGAPVVAVVAFEVLLNAAALFNHANVRLPLGLDRVLRRVIVTPDMHRVHHSIHRDETDSNFGFNLSLWDRLFGTYRDQPRDGHAGMTLGLAVFRSSRERWLPRLLIQPFICETLSSPALESVPVPGARR